MKRKSRRPANRNRFLGELRSQGLSFAREIFFASVAVLFINSFVMASFEVPTPSMERTVMVGDRVLVNKFIYGGTTPYTIPFTSIRIPHLRVPGFRGVERGDVVVFDWPGERDQIEKPTQMFFLKRCIGLPGDTVRIDRRTVTVNGTALPLPEHTSFLRPQPMPTGLSDPGIFPRGAAFNQDNWGPIRIPRRGDKIALSADNLSQWEVFMAREGHQAELRDGKVLIDGIPVTEYTVARDYIFGMGDNRDNSLDGRFWGFIPVEDVIGTPMVVFWSWDPQIPFYDVGAKLLSINLRRVGTIIR